MERHTERSRETKTVRERERKRSRSSLVLYVWLKPANILVTGPVSVKSYWTVRTLCLLIRGTLSH